VNKAPTSGGRRLRERRKISFKNHGFMCNPSTQKEFQAMEILKDREKTDTSSGGLTAGSGTDRVNCLRKKKNAAAGGKRAKKLFWARKEKGGGGGYNRAGDEYTKEKQGKGVFTQENGTGSKQPTGGSTKGRKKTEQRELSTGKTNQT